MPLTCYLQDLEVFLLVIKIAHLAHRRHLNDNKAAREKLGPRHQLDSMHLLTISALLMNLFYIVHLMLIVNVKDPTHLEIHILHHPHTQLHLHLFSIIQPFLRSLEQTVSFLFSIMLKGHTNNISQLGS